MLLLAVFFVCKQASASILINEIQIGDEDSSKNEFIELFNSGNADIVLDGFRLMKKTKNGSSFSTLVSSNHFDGTIDAGGYFVIAHPQYKNVINADSDYSNVGYSIAVDNAVGLFDSNGDLLDLVGYGSANSFEGTKSAREFEEGKSIGRIDAKDTDNNFSDFFLLEMPSPGEENIKKLEDNDDGDKKEEREDPEDKKEILDDDDDKDESFVLCEVGIEINEIYPFKEEFVEVVNNGDSECSLKNWSITDVTGSENSEQKWSSHRKEFGDISITPGGFVVLGGNLFLNDSGDSVKLFNSDKQKIQEIAYEKGTNGLSYSFNGSDWKWTRASKGSENIFGSNKTKNVVVDEDIYVNVWANFLVKGLNKKDKVVWNFGDGHSSYKQKTKHKFEKEGKYECSLKVNGDVANIQQFSVEVKEYPEKKIRIIAVNANPKGKDSDFETITLENKSKKKVNLTGWSIATGWDKLINHPIYEDFEIKAGKVREITREFSKFSLNNKQLKIELRYPNGEVASKVKYKLEKSIAEGGLYKKINNKWQWIFPTNNKQKLSTSNQSSVISNQNAGDQQSIISNQNVGVDQPLVIGNQKLQSVVEIENKMKELEILPVEGQVLGLGEVKEEDGKYVFAAHTSENEHYAVVFLKNIFSDLNFSFNKMLNLL